MKNKDEIKTYMLEGMSIGMCIGVSLGVNIGIFINNIPFWNKYRIRAWLTYRSFNQKR